jgi:putative SOS response-associated peptidase YedK
MRGAQKLTAARWGLVTNPDPAQHDRSRYLINTKAETVESRPTFAEAFALRRCVIPASGFYEWSGPSSARQPFWIHRRDGDLLFFAGLYQDGEKNDPGAQTAFTILTCAANSMLATIHDRMPVILSDRDADDWINPSTKRSSSLKRLLKPTADGLLLVHSASPLVNSVRNEGPQLLGDGKIEQQMLFKF